MNNYDRIRQMSLDEMVEFIRQADCNNICAVYRCENRTCDDGCGKNIKEWLESEEENE